jgi:cell division septation protein DedD
LLGEIQSGGGQRNILVIDKIRGDPVPWPSNGDYYSFKEEVIRHRAPAVSGVYGIYNFKHHILISHSNNIRESLLRHHRETKFRFRRLEPSGFTFAVCPPESREFRFRQLTWEYQPIVRPGETVGLAAWWRSWTTPRAQAFSRQIGALKQPAVAERRRKTPITAGNDLADREGARRDQFALAGFGFALIIVAMALFVLLGENRSVAENWTKQILSLAHHFTAFAEQGSPAPSANPPPQAKVTGDGTLAHIGSSAPAIDIPAEQQTGAGEPSIESAAGAANAPTTPPVASPRTEQPDPTKSSERKETAKSESAGGESRFRSWTVQALATTDIHDAMTWLERLKAKGYDAFIVEAEIKGQRWYRLRVGNFSRHQEAVELGKILMSKEGFGDAFVAHNTKTDVILALSR